jgi:hypothetical protein
VERAGAPWIVETPSKLLALVGGSAVRSLVPDRLLVLRGPDVDVSIYPNDVAITGKRKEVARARAAIASRMPFTAAYLTASKEGQRVEDRLMSLASGPADEAPRALEEVDRRLASLVVPEDEWEVLYRERLQIERDLLRDGNESQEAKPRRPSIVARLARLVRGVLP